MRRLLARSLTTALLLAGTASAQPSPLPPVLPGPAASPATPPATPAPAGPTGLPATPGVPFNPAKVTWPTEVGGRTISSVVGDLRNADPTVQEAALRAIQYFGPEAARKFAMRAVIPMVENADPGVRTNAILLIGAVGFDNAKDFDAAVAKLGALLGNTAKGSIMRLHATRALATLGAEAHAAIPVLCGLADDPSWEVRAALADALGRLGPAVYEQSTVLDGPTAVKVPKLKREASRAAMQKLSFVLIKDPSSSVRMEACQALITLGPPHVADPKQYAAVSQPFTDAIASRLKFEKEPVVKIWLNLLHMMYDERVFPAALKLIEAEVHNADVGIRLQALGALAILGPKALPALDEVARALHTGDTPVQVAAIQSMVAMGEDSAKTVLPELDRFVAETKQADVRAYAVEAVKFLRKNKPAPPAPVVAKP